MAGTTNEPRDYAVALTVQRSREPVEAQHDSSGDSEYQVEVRRLEAANEELRTPPEELFARLRRSVETGQHLSQLAERMKVDVQDLLDALDAASSTGPAAPSDPARHLSDGEAAALRRSGALHVAMPPSAERASTSTAARTATLSATALTVGQVASLLGRTEGRIRQRLTEHTMLGVRDARGWRIPAFQFDDGAELPGWDRVVAALPDDVHPLTVARFLDTPNADLVLDGDAVTPRRWLTSGGDTGIVVDLATQLHRVA